MIDASTEKRLPELQEAWRESGSLRIEGFLREGVADQLLASLRHLPHVIRASQGPGLQFLFYELALQPEESCDHITCQFARWLFADGRQWLAQLTGLPLVAPKDGQLIATAYAKGSYLDPHNDVDGERVIAYVLGLTPGSWPAEQGGHLEFLDSAKGVDDVQVRERRAPGWNTLDIFDVREPGHTHQIPLLRQAQERRVLSGWFYRR